MDFILNAKTRNHDDSAKKLRKDGWVPGCVYGKSCDAINIVIAQKDLKKCLAAHATKLTLDVEGRDKYLVGIEELQRGPLQNGLIHISFHAMSANEVAHLHIPVEFTGKALGQMEGGILKENFHEVTVKGLPADLPDRLLVDVSKMNIGDSIQISDIASQYNFEFLQDDYSKVLVSCGHPRVQSIETPVDEEMESIETEASTSEDAGAEKDAA
jgi:large subunit ribosomal protein L25